MTTYSVKQARMQLSSMLKRAERGESIVVSRRGKAIAVIKQSPQKAVRLPALSEFRKSIKVSGSAMSKDIGSARSAERQ